MIAPRKARIGVLGLGSSVATPNEGIEAEALVVRSFEELDQPDVSKKVKGNNFQQTEVVKGFRIME